MPTGPPGNYKKHKHIAKLLEDTYNWTDYFGYACEWYVINDMPGCELYADDYEGGFRVLLMKLLLLYAGG